MWIRWPLVKDELTDIDCDSHERHRDSSLAGDRDGGNAHAGGFYRQTESDYGVKVSEMDRVEVTSAGGRLTRWNRRRKQGKLVEGTRDCMKAAEFAGMIVPQVGVELNAASELLPDPTFAETNFGSD